MLLIVGSKARCDQSEAARANEAITIMWGFFFFFFVLRLDSSARGDGGKVVVRIFRRMEC